MVAASLAEHDRKRLSELDPQLPLPSPRTCHALCPVRRTRLGNLFFWASLTTGLTICCVLYGRWYCVDNPGLCVGK
jgi:hypothetical protein